MAIRIVDVTDEASYALLPPCADEGSTTARATTGRTPIAVRRPLAPRGRSGRPSRRRRRPRPPTANPFAPDRSAEAFNPFAAASKPAAFNPFADDDEAPIDNPFAPRREPRPGVSGDAPPKLRLLGRGLAVFGVYAKVLLKTGAMTRPRARAVRARAPRARAGARARARARARRERERPRALPAPAGLAPARGDQLHRVDRRGARWARRDAGRRGLRRPRVTGLRRRRDLPRGRGEAERDERGPAGVLPGSASGSSSRHPTIVFR